MTEYGFPVFTLCSVVLDLLPLTQDVSGTQLGTLIEFYFKLIICITIPEEPKHLNKIICTLPILKALLRKALSDRYV